MLGLGLEVAWLWPSFQSDLALASSLVLPNTFLCPFYRITCNVDCFVGQSSLLRRSASQDRQLSSATRSQLFPYSVGSELLRSARLKSISPSRIVDRNPSSIHAGTWRDTKQTTQFPTRLGATAFASFWHKAAGEKFGTFGGTERGLGLSRFVFFGVKWYTLRPYEPFKH